MPLCYKQMDEITGPVVICDYCGEEITHAENGNAVYNYQDITGIVYYTHKGGCLVALEKERGVDGWCTDDLDVFLAYLTANLHWNKTKATRKAALLKNFV